MAQTQTVESSKQPLNGGELQLVVSATINGEPVAAKDVVKMLQAQPTAQAQPQEQPTAQPALAPAVVEQSFYQNYIRPALPYVITFAAGGTIGVLAANYFGDDDEDDDAGIDAE